VNIVSAASVIVRVEPLVIVPMPWSMLHVGVGAGLFAYVQANVTLVAAPIVTDAGVAVNVPMIGATGTATTWTKNVRVRVPAALVHVSVKVVEDVSVMLVVWPLVTAPTWGLIEHAGAGFGLPT
jgi:hypothetical protein